jgi:hypothetical protein
MDHRLVLALERRSDASVPPDMDDLAVASARLLDHADVTVQLRTSGWPTSGVGASSRRARDAEEQQLAMDQGPTIDAYRTGHAIVGADLGVDGRWPMIAPVLAELGFRSASAHPLFVGTVALGSLTRYGTAAVVREDDARHGARVARAVVRLVCRDRGSVGEELGDLPWIGSSSVESRAVIHQATGMVAAQLDSTVDEAFARLRARAFVEGRPVDEVALDVRSRRTRFLP